MAEFSDAQSRLYKHWFALAIVIIAMYVIWLNFAGRVLGNGLLPALLVFIVQGLAVWVGLIALREIRDLQRMSAWRVLIVGLLIWLIVDGLALLEWAINGTLGGAPSFRDLLSMAGYLAVGYALASYPMSHPERFGRVREAMDAAILVLAVLSLAWLVFLRPSTVRGNVDIPQIFWLAINPVFDVVLIVFAFRQALLRVRIRRSVPFLLISIAAAILFVADLGASFEGLDSPPSASLIQAGWMTAAAIFGISIQRAARETDELGLALDHEPIVRLASRMEPLIPVALTYTVVGFLLFDWWFSGELDWVGVGLSVALIILLFGRQAIILGQQEMRQFAALVHATGDLAFIIEQDGSLRMANPALLFLLGNPRRAALPNLLGYLELSEQTQDEHRTVLEQAAQKGWSGEALFNTPEAGIIPVLLSLDPVVSARTGEVLIAGTAHDLSQIHEREEDLRAALAEVDSARAALTELNADLENKVEARTIELKKTVADLARLNEELTTLDQLKSEFVALVSHELRSPLTNIRSGIEVVLDAHPDLSSETRESLALVEAETRRLSGFVETILDISALEAGKFHIERQEFSIEDAFENARKRLSRQLEERDLIIDFAADLPAICSDRSVLESIFYHLLDNASKYAPEGAISVKAREQPGKIEISLRDEGVGIPDDQRENVFEMFHRLDASDSREVYGHGLGLPMVKRLLEALGGGIEIESENKPGTTMKFWVPVEVA